MDPVPDPPFSEPSKHNILESACTSSTQAGSSSTEALVTSPKTSNSIITDLQRHMIVNICKYVIKMKPKYKCLSDHDIVKKTSEICGLNESIVQRTLTEYRDEIKNSKPRPQIIDRYHKSAIRKIIHNFYWEGEVPTLKNLFQVVEDNPSLPALKMKSLRRIIEDLEFKFLNRQDISILIDRMETVLWRVKYLQEMKAVRVENRRVFYIGETWVNIGHTEGKPLVDTKIKSAKKKISTGLVVVHVGNEEGFLEGCDWLFETSTAGNYHNCIDTRDFEEWFSKVLEKLQPNDVVVVDDASFHLRCTEEIPTIDWKKDDIKSWLRSKNISFDNEEFKLQLMAKVKKVQNDSQTYVIDDMAKQKGVTVLHLPPYHFELNPTELILADIKDYVDRQDTTFKLGDVKKLLGEVTKDKWKNFVENAKQEEIKMDALDHKIDEVEDEFLTDFPDCDTSDSSCDSDYAVYY